MSFSESEINKISINALVLAIPLSEQREISKVRELEEKIHELTATESLEVGLTGHVALRWPD